MNGRLLELPSEKLRREGRIGMLVNLVNKGLLSISNASIEANMTEEQFSKHLKNMKVEV